MNRLRYKSIYFFLFGTPGLGRFPGLNNAAIILTLTAIAWGLFRRSQKAFSYRFVPVVLLLLLHSRIHCMQFRSVSLAEKRFPFNAMWFVICSEVAVNFLRCGFSFGTSHGLMLNTRLQVQWCLHTRAKLLSCFV